MNKVQELIERLCPKGVEYKKLGEVCESNRGVRVIRNILADNGEYPVYQNSLTPLGYYDKSNYPANTTFIICAGAAGEIGFSERPIWAADDCLCITCPNTIISKYVYYCLQNNKIFLSSRVRRAGVPRLARTAVEQFETPLPPIEVQAEIVRILDHFTTLAAELQARREQYEYYRNHLLTFGQEVEWKTMGEIMTISRGASPRPIQAYLTEEPNGIPWIKIGDISPNSKYITSTVQKIKLSGVSKSRLLHKGDFVLSNSMSFGRPYILGIDGCIHDGWVYIKDFQDSFLSDFLYYILKSDSIQNFWKQNAGQGGAVSNLNADIIRRTPIPLPPMEEQQRIVAILDKFEALVNDLSEGLPAEIAAVQQQYEYYRNQLLNFERREVDVN